MAARRRPIEQDAIGEELAGWGKVALIETRGRRSGRPARAAVGFVDEPSGTLVVAAGDDHADWVLNLGVNPQCRATIGDESRSYVARELAAGERAAAITSLILKYGTPAERLGRGPAFRLTPTGG